MKLIGIMSELIRGMVDKLAQAPWTKTSSTTNSSSVNSPSPSPSPPSSVSALDEIDECVKTLMKQTCSLHRALSDLLLVEQRDDIFRQISQTFLKTLKDFIAQLDLNKPAVKMKVSYNMNHIINRLVQSSRACLWAGLRLYFSHAHFLSTLLVSSCLDFVLVRVSTNRSSNNSPLTSCRRRHMQSQQPILMSTIV